MIPEKVSKINPSHRLGEAEDCLLRTVELQFACVTIPMMVLVMMMVLEFVSSASYPTGRTSEEKARLGRRKFRVSPEENRGRGYWGEAATARGGYQRTRLPNLAVKGSMRWRKAAGGGGGEEERNHKGVSPARDRGKEKGSGYENEKK